MKTKSLFILIIFALTIFSMSCEKWLSVDITEESPILLSPYDSLHTSSNSILFWWDTFDGAESYEIQIVSPCFDSIEELVLDSTVTRNKYETSLLPGSYEWRVRGINESYASQYSYHLLYIDSTNNLSDLSVILLEPASNEYFNFFEIDFDWGDISMADIYRFEVHIDTWEGDNLFMPLSLEESDCGILFEEEGTFFWGVQASNSTSSTPFKYRSFIIDTTPPSIPTILSPLSDTIFESELAQAGINISWSHSDQTGAPLIDSLQIYNDSLGNQLLQNHVGTDTVLLFTNNINYQTYYFRIKSSDLAGNSGLWSNLYKVVYEE